MEYRSFLIQLKSMNSSPIHFEIHAKTILLLTIWETAEPPALQGRGRIEREYSRLRWAISWMVPRNDTGVQSSVRIIKRLFYWYCSIRASPKIVPRSERVLDAQIGEEGTIDHILLTLQNFYKFSSRLRWGSFLTNLFFPKIATSIFYRNSQNVVIEMPAVQFKEFHQQNTEISVDVAAVTSWMKLKVNGGWERCNPTGGTWSIRTWRKLTHIKMRA